MKTSRTCARPLALLAICAMSAVSTALWTFAARSALAEGTVTGQGRFERIKGRPAMGHAPLYESNLFLSRDGGVGIGPSRRLGAPPGEAPRHDGFYAVKTSEGSYSILVNQPLFFIRPKVVPDVVVQEGRTKVQNVELPIDFSTYFTDTWALPFGDVWYQTFVATGASIVGVSWKLAGTNATRIRASVHEDDGSPDPRSWPQVSAAASKVDDVGAQTDNWVRWRSGEVPTTPGTRYAIRLTGVEGGDRGFSPYNRGKDASSYEGGRAHNGAGQAQDYDLNVTVFCDNDGTAVLLSKTTKGLGELRDGYYGGRWGQTFTATVGNSLAAADVWAAGADHVWDLDFTWRVRKGGPAGPLVGPEKTTKAAYQAFGAGLHGVSWSPGEVPLEAGAVYYVEFTNPVGFNPYVCDRAEDAYAGGAAYQDGTLKAGGAVDLSMTIVVYTSGGGTVRGKVTDAVTRVGLAGATVSLSTLGRSVTADATGAYEIVSVPPGTHGVRASMAGYEPTTESGVGVAEGETAVVDFALEREPCAHVFRNAGFEAAFDGWKLYGGAKTSNPGAGWFGGISPQEGARFWGNEVNGAALGTGGAWQRLCAEPGHRYRASAWSNIYWIDGSPDRARSRIGLHPSGGTESDASVVWSAWDQQPLEAKGGWREIAVEARAAGPVVTVFLEFEQRDSDPGRQWRISCFDGVAVEDLDLVIAPLFVRADCRNDGTTDLTDAVYLLNHLFLGGETPPCLSACDSNDDGGVDLSDAVAILGFLFLGAEAPPVPWESCGPDPTPDALACDAFEC